MAHVMTFSLQPVCPQSQLGCDHEDSGCAVPLGRHHPSILCQDHSFAVQRGGSASPGARLAPGLPCLLPLSQAAARGRVAEERLNLDDATLNSFAEVLVQGSSLQARMPRLAICRRGASLTTSLHFVKVKRSGNEMSSHSSHGWSSAQELCEDLSERFSGRFSTQVHSM